MLSLTQPRVDSRHWSQVRLARLNIKNNEGYAFEELVAELGAAFQCLMLGVSAEPREDHAKYLNNWIKALKDDKRLIYKAAKLASRQWITSRSINPPLNNQLKRPPSAARGDQHVSDTERFANL